jgi:hypothetical protein
MPSEIYIRPSTIVQDDPFRDDAIGDRRALAERLTGYIDRLRSGCVIAIDGSWGSGKSWFGTHWLHLLKARQFRTGWLDAFACDYSEDPFLPIAANINSLAPTDTDRASLTTQAVKIGKRLVPTLGKALIGVAARVIVGAEAVENVRDALEGISDDAEDLAEEIIRDQLKSHEETQGAIESYRARLTEFAAASKNPIVFFVDELDRCRPDFAIRLIERLKHFFDVPNIIFVLLMNREQLEAAVQGLYGSTIDAQAYLTKFIHFYERLSTPANTADNPKFARNYCVELAKRYKHPPNDQGLIRFIDHLTQLAGPLELSLRDLERAFIEFNMIDGNARSNITLLTYLIAIKIRRPQMLEHLCRETPRSHLDAESVLMNRMTAPSFPYREYGLQLVALHHFLAPEGTVEAVGKPEDEKLLTQLFGNQDIRETFNRILRSVAYKNS